LFQNILMSATAVLYIPRLLAIVVVVALVVLATAASTRSWVHNLVAVLLLVSSAAVSVWVLQLGWALAVIGVLALLSGVLWRVLQSDSSRSGGLMWPGLGLLLAPFANIFILMPVLIQVVH